MNAELEVGDRVTWRESDNALAICNCTVLRLGYADDGRPAALIKLPPPFNHNAGAAVTHLHKQEGDE